LSDIRENEVTVDKVGRILTRKEICELTSLSMSQIRRLEKRGLFPRRVKIGARRVGHFEREVMAWLDEKRAERDAKR
jgi:prophage regulatory protein